MDEDMILPDDYQEATPQAEDIGAETQEMDSDSFETEEVVEDTTPTTEPLEATQEPVTTPKVKIKYNSEERELDLEEAAMLAQKGLNYEKAVERARQEARDAWVAEQGYEWNGNPIKTEAEYKQALQEKELMEKYQDVPEELRQEIIENRKFRDQIMQQQKQQEEQAKKTAEIDEFLEYFQSVNERPFDSAKDAIPEEVKAAMEKGTPLKYAFMEYQTKQYRTQLKIAKQNEANTKRAPVGSVTAFGGTKTEPEDDFLAGFNSF